jgi:hypothetical protein
VIRRAEQYHGAAIARLIRAETSVAIKVRTHAVCRSAYVLDERIALYVKYSTNRLSPWTFGFMVGHQQEIAGLRDEFEDVFVVLVCGFDGIACLSCLEYQRVLDDDPRSGEWIRVARSSRQKYSITGSDDRRVCKIGDNEFPAKVYRAIGGSGDQQATELAGGGAA